MATVTTDYVGRNVLIIRAGFLLSLGAFLCSTSLSGGECARPLLGEFLLCLIGNWYDWFAGSALKCIVIVCILMLYSKLVLIGTTSFAGHTEM